MADTVDSSHLKVDASDPFGDNPSRVNLLWLDQTLWVGAPPSMDHLKVMPTDVNAEALKSVPIDIPDDLIENGFVFEFAELIGVPIDGIISHGQLDTPGVWRIPSDHLDDLTISVPESFQDDVVHLTLKIMGFDEATEKNHTQMANIRVEFSVPSEPNIDPNHLIDETEATSMSKIVIRLGGAPEYGDPHYRVRVEGRQVANGNLDWSMGLPALTEEGPVDFLCWHEVAVEWDFGEGIPHRISLSFDYDHTVNNETDCLLAVDWLEVNGLKIPSSSDYVKVEGAHIPWPDNDQIWSWSGELVFDVTGAFTEGPAFIDLMGEQVLELEPEPALILEPEPTLIVEPEPEPETVLEPEPIPQREPAPEPMLQREPALNLGSELTSEPEPEPIPEAVFEVIPEPVPEPIFEAVPEPEPIQEPVSVSEPEPEPERIEDQDDRRLVYIDALKLKRTFLRRVFWRATANLGLTKPQEQYSKSTKIEVVPEVIDLDVTTPTPTSIPEKQAEENVKAFYGHVLKRALDTLEEANAPHLPSDDLDSADVNEDTTEELQNLGVHIKNQYFASILQKANVSLSL